jgi:hypothetical protein
MIKFWVGFVEVGFIRLLIGHSDTMMQSRMLP